MKKFKLLNFLLFFFFINSLSYIDASNLEKPIYDATGYLNKNIQNNRIFIPIKILYEDKLLPFGTENIDINYLVNLAKALPKSSVPYILDIECWDIRPNRFDFVANYNIDKYILVIKTMKEARPDLKFGYFGTVPTVDYVRPRLATAIEVERWKLANLRAKRLAKYVDVICPAPYTFYDDKNLWKKQMAQMLSEAKKYKKPIITFLWPEYSDFTELKGKFLSDDLWYEELRLAYAESDGVAIWGGRNFTVKPTVSREWDEDARWWAITKEFILERKN